jgi:hypothetical protein
MLPTRSYDQQRLDYYGKLKNPDMHACVRTYVPTHVSLGRQFHIHADLFEELPRRWLVTQYLTRIHVLVPTEYLRPTFENP